MYEMSLNIKCSLHFYFILIFTGTEQAHKQIFILDELNRDSDWVWFLKGHQGRKFKPPKFQNKPSVFSIVKRQGPIAQLIADTC